MIGAVRCLFLLGLFAHPHIRTLSVEVLKTTLLRCLWEYTCFPLVCGVLVGAGLSLSHF